MRISAYNAINQVYHTSKTSAVNKSNNVKSASDKLEISQTARSYQVAKAAVEETPDVRKEKVAQIKAMMEAGTYNVKPADIADKLMSNVDTLSF